MTDPRVQPLQPQLLRLAQLHRAEADVGALEHDVADAALAGQHPQPRHQQQVLHRLRQLAVAVDEFLADGRDVLLGVGGGDGPVGLQTQPLAGRVVVRDVRVDRQLDLDLERRLLLARRRSPADAVVRDGLADHPDVQVEADARDVAGLLAAEQVARAADLQVLHRDVHARAHLGVLGDGGEPLVRGLRERLLRRVEEVGVAALAAAAHPAAQLVQLGQAEGVAALHDQCVGVGDVDAGLDDRGGDQHVELLLPEVDDDLFQRRSPPSGRGRWRSAPRARSRAAARPRGRWTRPGCGCRRPGPRAAVRGGSRRRSASARTVRRRSAPGGAPPAGW